MLLFDALAPGFHAPFLQPNIGWSVYTQLFDIISSMVSGLGGINLSLFFILFYVATVIFSATTTPGYMARFLEFKNNPLVLFFVIFIPIYLLFQPSVINIVEFDTTTASTTVNPTSGITLASGLILGDYENVTVIRQYPNIPLVLSVPLAIAQSFTHGISHYNCDIDDSSADNLTYKGTFAGSTVGMCSVGETVGSLGSTNSLPVSYDRKHGFTEPSPGTNCDTELCLRNVSIRDYWYSSSQSTTAELDAIHHATLKMSGSPSDIILNDISKIRNAINNLSDNKCAIGPTLVGAVAGFGLICNHYQTPGSNLSQILSGFFAEAYYLRNILAAKYPNPTQPHKKDVIDYLDHHPIITNLFSDTTIIKSANRATARNYYRDSITAIINGTKQNPALFGAALVAHYTDNFMILLRAAQLASIPHITDDILTNPANITTPMAYNYFFTPVANDINWAISHTMNANCTALSGDYSSALVDIKNNWLTEDALTPTDSDQPIAMISHDAFKLKRIPALQKACKELFKTSTPPLSTTQINTKLKNIKDNFVTFLGDINKSYYDHFLSTPYSAITIHEDTFWNNTLPTILASVPPTPLTDNDINLFAAILRYTFTPPTQDIRNSNQLPNYFTSGNIVDNQNNPNFFQILSPISTSGHVGSNHWQNATTATVNQLLTTGIDKNAFTSIISLILKTGFVDLSVTNSDSANAIRPTANIPYNYTPFAHPPVTVTQHTASSLFDALTLTPPASLTDNQLADTDFVNTYALMGSQTKKLYPLDTQTTPLTLPTPTLSTSFYNKMNLVVSDIIKANFVYYTLKDKNIPEFLCVTTRTTTTTNLCEKITDTALIKFTPTNPATAITVDDLYNHLTPTLAPALSPLSTPAHWTTLMALSTIQGAINNSTDNHSVFLRPIISQLVEMWELKSQILALPTSTPRSQQNERDYLWLVAQHGISQNRLITSLMSGYNINTPAGTEADCTKDVKYTCDYTDNHKIHKHQFENYQHILLDPQLIRLTAYFPTRAPNHLVKINFDPLMPDLVETTTTFNSWVQQPALGRIADNDLTIIIPIDEETVGGWATALKNFLTWPIRVVLTKINEFILTTIGGLASGYISYSNLYTPIPPAETGYAMSPEVFPPALGMHTTTTLSSITNPTLTSGSASDPEKFNTNAITHYISFFQKSPNLSYVFPENSSLDILQRISVAPHIPILINSHNTNSADPSQAFNDFIINIEHASGQYYLRKSNHFNNNYKINLSNSKSAKIATLIDKKNTNFINNNQNLVAATGVAAVSVTTAFYLDIVGPLLKATKITAFALGIFILSLIVFSIIFTFKFITKIMFLKILPFLMLLLIVPFNFFKMVGQLALKGTGVTPEETFSVFVEKSITAPTLMLLSLTFQVVFYISVFNHLFVSLYYLIGTNVLEKLYATNTLILFEVFLTLSMGIISLVLLFVLDIFDRIPFFKANPAELWRGKPGA